jgi:hypothetical protein
VHPSPLQSFPSRPFVADADTEGTAYGPDVAFENGSSEHFVRRERPKLVFDGDGRPVALTNGVNYMWPGESSGGMHDATFSLVLPIAAEGK